jgi:hypothetical protein
MTVTALTALIVTALTAITSTDTLGRVVAALTVFPAATLASNDYLTVADFLRGAGTCADTELVATAINQMYPDGLDEYERELPSWACRPDAGLVYFK